MPWHPDDTLLAELREAQADLRLAESGLRLMTPDQRTLTLPGVIALRQKVSRLEAALE